MKYPITASIIIVQLDPEHEATAYVAYGRELPGAKQTRLELKLTDLSDATDLEMWIQMATARVCDGL